MEVAVVVLAWLLCGVVAWPFVYARQLRIPPCTPGDDAEFALLMCIGGPATLVSCLVFPSGFRFWRSHEEALAKAAELQQSYDAAVRQNQHATDKYVAVERERDELRRKYDRLLREWNLVRDGIEDANAYLGLPTLVTEDDA